MWKMQMHACGANSAMTAHHIFIILQCKLQVLHCVIMKIECNVVAIGYHVYVYMHTCICDCMCVHIRIYKVEYEQHHNYKFFCRLEVDCNRIANKTQHYHAATMSWTVMNALRHHLFLPNNSLECGSELQR